MSDKEVKPEVQATPEPKETPETPKVPKTEKKAKSNFVKLVKGKDFYVGGITFKKDVTVEVEPELADYLLQQTDGFFEAVEE